MKEFREKIFQTCVAIILVFVLVLSVYNARYVLYYNAITEYKPSYSEQQAIKYLGDSGYKCSHYDPYMEEKERDWDAYPLSYLGEITCGYSADIANGNSKGVYISETRDDENSNYLVTGYFEAIVPVIISKDNTNESSSVVLIKSLQYSYKNGLSTSIELNIDDDSCVIKNSEDIEKVLKGQTSIKDTEGVQFFDDQYKEINPSVKTLDMCNKVIDDYSEELYEYYYQIETDDNSKEIEDVYNILKKKD